MLNNLIQGQLKVSMKYDLKVELTNIKISLINSTINHRKLYF